MNRILSSTLALALGALAAHAPANAPPWRSYGVLAVPQQQYTFLASTPKGGLIATTFHNREAGSPPLDIPAFLVGDPISFTPNVVELCRVEFPNQRGYSGVASDPSGAFFISGDTGDRATSFIRRFNADGTPDLDFGSGGEWRPGRRCLGIDVLGEYLMVAVDWGEVMVVHARNGTPLGNIEPRETKPFIRDLAIDPKSLDIYGVAQGAVYRWRGGQPWNRRGYRLEQVSPTVGELRSDEGLSFDPFARAALVAPIPGNALLEIFEDGKSRTTTVGSAGANAHLADSVLSFDGSTLFMSDKTGRQIHILKRSMDRADMAAATPAPPSQNRPRGTAAPAAASGTAKVQWHHSYAASVERARQQRLPMVVYFRSPEVERCLTFEREMLLSEAFATAARGHVCVFEDLTRDPLMAYRFGVYRVPAIVVLDADGQTVAEFVRDIPEDALFAALK